MIRTLVVDDSAVARRALIQALARDPEIEIVGSAPDPYVARELIATARPDVMTLDIEMPRMDGITFLKHVMRHRPIPTIIISSLSRSGRALAVEALSAGAFDVVPKPEGAAGLAELGRVLTERVRAAAAVDAHRLTHPVAPAQAIQAPVAHHPWIGPRIVAIGASTGGTVALERLLCALPAESPPIVIVQHMPAGFTKSFADRLNSITAIDVREAADGDALRPGLALVAPGNHHLTVAHEGPHLVARLSEAPPVNRHRPSVDVLFDSVATHVGSSAVAALLTGMGADGANGLLTLHKLGVPTIAQDESTCVVFGMPRVAIELGAADEVLPLPDIPSRLLDLARRPR